MRRHRGHTIKKVLLLLGIEFLVIIGILLYVQLRPMVVKAVTMEAGSSEPDVEEFLLYKNRQGSFITNIGNITEPGFHEIKIQIGKRIYSSGLHIIDTVAPTATARELLVLRDDEVDPMMFLTDIRDGSEVTAYFKEMPDTSAPGEKEITLLLQDQGGNVTELHTVMTVLDIRGSVTVEAGTGAKVTMNDFVGNDKYDVTFATDPAMFDLSKPAVHDIIINVNGREVSAAIHVVDTTAPQAVMADKKSWVGEELPPDAFVSNITDVSNVTAEYSAEPDFTKFGEQEVRIRLTDDYGNSTVKTAMLTLEEDTQPPKIMGTSDKTVYVGEGVAYKKGVFVTDNKDSELKFSVDSSKVNLKKPGVYPVVYTAKDSAGNKATLTINVTVVKQVVTQAMADEEADKVLAKIIKPNMTQLQKAEAIYRWIKKHVGYTGDSDKTDWLAEAYRAFTKKEGDCFTFFAVAQELLTRAGIENMRVTRLGGKTQHFWNLVDCGDGWYHFDSCPNRDHVETFMLTDAELDAFADTRGSYYYNRDKTLYPETSKISIQSKVLQSED